VHICRLNSTGICWWKCSHNEARYGDLGHPSETCLPWDPSSAMVTFNTVAIQCD
jgi:hypothetical protein